MLKRKIESIFIFMLTKNNFLSDIMTVQQIARRNFNLYYIQENLIELKAKQIAENKLMNEAEEFAEVRYKLLLLSLKQIHTISPLADNECWIFTKL